MIAARRYRAASKACEGVVNDKTAAEHRADNPPSNAVFFSQHTILVSAWSLHLHPFRVNPIPKPAAAYSASNAFRLQAWRQTQHFGQRRRAIGHTPSAHTGCSSSVLIAPHYSAPSTYGSRTTSSWCASHVRLAIIPRPRSCSPTTTSVGLGFDFSYFMALTPRLGRRPAEPVGILDSGDSFAVVLPPSDIVGTPPSPSRSPVATTRSAPRRRLHSDGVHGIYEPYNPVGDDAAYNSASTFGRSSP
uniref:Uncharacterized protein n=1 Tax=Mycena chlorophos TaxID=658473 RepID=A0ABQ0M6Z3_MYCCL|nr:predicted protein [Mycena chlorophos]